MGLLQSLGRLWNGPSSTRNQHGTHAPNGEPSRRAPVAIDLHTPRSGPDVDAIDRELTDRLGLKPSPLPSREAARGGVRHAEMAAVTPRTRSESPAVVTGEVLEIVGAADGGSDSGSREMGHAEPARASAPAEGGLMSALLALPDRHGRGKIRSKQQLLDQLRDNYEEVLRVVRKVDGTLDQQHRRGERMLEIAEHTVHGRLPELREETRKVGDAIDRLATGIGRGQDRLEKGVADQIAAIERVQGLLTQLVEADRSLGDSLVEFRRTAAGMAGATERLGSALAGIQDRAMRRDDQIAEILDRSQKTLVTVMVLGVVSVAAAITMVVLAVV